MSSREIDWYPVWMFVRPLLRSAPWPGTPAWCALSDHDPAKLAPVLLAGALWALAEATRQDAERDTHREIRAAADWSAVARRLHRGPAYIPREGADH